MKHLILPLALLSASPAFAAGGPFFSLWNSNFVVLLAFLVFIGILLRAKVPAMLTGMLDARANQIKAELDEARALREALRRNERLLEIWPAYYDGEEARGELESLGSVDGLPDDPEERLALVIGGVATASGQVAELEVDAAEARLQVWHLSHQFLPEHRV